MKEKKNIAILLAAGVGSRMGTGKKKQFMKLGSKPVLQYSLETFEASAVIDEILLVACAEDMEFVRDEIISACSFKKVTAVISGGNERYLSVWEALKYIYDRQKDCYVYIHDAARPFISEDILLRLKVAVEDTGACVTGVPAQDTVRLAEGDLAGTTIPRERVWLMQTPQVFDMGIIYPAFSSIIQKNDMKITDDVMVVQAFAPDTEIRLVMGSYANRKITNPEDLTIASGILLNLKNGLKE